MYKNFHILLMYIYSMGVWRHGVDTKEVKKQKAVIFLSEGIEHNNFFSNMTSAFVELGYKCIFLTADLSVYLQLKTKSKEDVLLVKKHRHYCDVNHILESKECIEGSLSKRDAILLYESVYFYCDLIGKNYDISIILASQGIKVPELSLKEYAEKNNIKILFFELANIKGKIFFDKEGSNAKSYLYEHIDLLDRLIVNRKSYSNWRSKYIKDNFNKHIVKQAVNIKKFNIKYGLISRFGYLYTGLRIRKLDLYFKIKSFIKSRQIKLKYDNVDLKTEKYIFFPMQVSNDSQIILNSDIGLLDGLYKAYKEAQKSNLKLVVKLHPAEKNVCVIEKILKMREIYKFKIVDENVFSIINNAEKIITINSTVALEAMILGKEVTILGRSYYKYFDEERIKKYIMGYLVNMDFFSNQNFTVEQISQLLCRCKE